MSSGTMTNRPAKVLITRIVSLNPGDAAILQGTIRILQQKYGQDTEVVVYDSKADIAQRYYPWARFKPALYPSASSSRVAQFLRGIGYGHWIDRVRHLKHRLALRLIATGARSIAKLTVSTEEFNTLVDYATADLILSTGGTYLTENYDLQGSIRDYRISLLSGTPLGFFTQSLGPFSNPKNIETFRKIFSASVLMLVRDNKSKKHLIDLGIESSRIHQVADAAFVLASPLDHKDDVLRNDESINLKLAISVRELRFFEDHSEEQYLKFVAKAVEHAVGFFKADVTFLSTCQGIEGYWTNDADTARSVLALVSSEYRGKVSIDDNFREPMELVHAYRQFDAVIATRMHAAILALCAGRATACIAYEFKLEELYDRIGLEPLCMPISNACEASAPGFVDTLLKNIPRYTKQTEDAVSFMSKSAWQASDLLPDIQSRHPYEKLSPAGRV